MIHSIAGLENAKIIRYGYAIEYDYVDPTELKHTLETKKIKKTFTMLVKLMQQQVMKKQQLKD